MTRKYFAAAAAVGLIALVVAGCGSSGSNSSSSSGSSAPAAAAGSGPSISGADTPLGKIVVDGKGRTLYRFAKDTGMKSMCAGACAGNWPPYTATSKPTAGGGVASGAISLVKRGDGASQVALDGHPLYYFSGDQAAGQMNGQGVNEFGAKWFTVAPSGSQVTAPAKSNSGSGGSTSSGGGGYSY